MSGPKDFDFDSNQDIADFGSSVDDYSDAIAADSWGNEWDSADDFGDMDFRLVDED